MNSTDSAAPPPLQWLPAIADPALVRQWDLATWQRVIRLARRLRLLARLGEAVAAAGLMQAVPAQAAAHLRADMRVSRNRTAALRWLLVRTRDMLGTPGYPLVLLKGAAYIAQNLDIARGRLSSDADVMVPRAHIGLAQAALASGGWVEAPLDEHDRRYYHEWSHEVPPLRHQAFALELDLHHNILPPLGRWRVGADRLMARLQPSGWAGWSVLQPADQVLHCAAHLFGDPDVRDRARDLVDLDGLLRQFGVEPGFWTLLPARARELGLGEPLALAAHYCTRWLNTPVPSTALAAIDQLYPAGWRRAALQALLDRLLVPPEPDTAPPWTQAAAAQVFLVRHHLRRLPLRLLLIHTWHKLRTRGAARRAQRDEPGDQPALP